MLKPNTPVLNVLGVVCLCTMSALSSSALAQVADNSEPVTLPTVVVSAPRPTPSADVAGYGDTPLARLPAAVTVINESALAASGARRLADVMKQDSAVSDAYNVVGYWDFATVRGFVLNNSYNYRRDGLPISAETFIALDNKSQVDVFKGTSGVQAGVAAPGGMMNYAVKRPPVREPIAAARLETTSTGAALAALDLGARFGMDKAFGYRLNLAGERLRDAAPGTRGERTLAALALDWRATPDSVFAVEVEQSRRSQPTVPALSLLGNTLSAPDPRLNVNTQAWSAPVQLAGLTGSVKFEQALSDTWRWSAHANRQALASNDRVAYGYGCSAGQTPVYDRYCANGDIDLYDYRSDGERRAQSGAALTLRGTPSWGGVAHQFVAGLEHSSLRHRFQPAYYTYLGTSNLYNPVALPASSAPDYYPSNRDERASSVFVSDTIAWTAQFSTWAGYRASRIQRTSSQQNGTVDTQYAQTIGTPWLAASYQLNPASMVYASASQGAESDVTPNKPSYTNAGQALPALKSQQFELGFKHDASRASSSNTFSPRYSATLFSIQRPAFGDAGVCDASASSCTRVLDGVQNHRGVELAAGFKLGALSLDSGLSYTLARRAGSALSPSNNGQAPINVPAWVLNMQAKFRLNGQVSATLGFSHEGKRSVLADASITLPAWTRVDAGLSAQTQLRGSAATWSVNVQNLTNARYFRESPTQYGHVFLLPQAPRSLRLGLSVAM